METLSEYNYRWIFPRHSFQKPGLSLGFDFARLFALPLAFLLLTDRNIIVQYLTNQVHYDNYQRKKEDEANHYFRFHVASWAPILDAIFNYLWYLSLLALLFLVPMAADGMTLFGLIDARSWLAVVAIYLSIHVRRFLKFISFSRTLFFWLF